MRGGATQLHLSCSLQDNYAMIKLRESIISQIALNTLFATCIDYMEEEMEKIDQTEKIKCPPRVLSVRYKVGKKWNK